MGQVAKSKEEFEQAWQDEFNQIDKLSWSIDNRQDREKYLSLISQARGFIKVASDNVYPGVKAVTCSECGLSHPEKYMHACPPKETSDQYVAHICQQQEAI